MEKREGCSCFNAALVDYAFKEKKSSLHKVICPVCNRAFTINRQGEEVVCFDCQKGLKDNLECTPSSG